MANKKIEGLEADLAQLRAQMEERGVASDQKMEEFSQQLSQIMAVLTTVSSAMAEKSGGTPSGMEVLSGDKRGFPQDRRITKVKMPLFDGSDVYGWIYRAERYFEVQGLPSEDHIRTAILCMEGTALAWYRWSDKRQPFKTWDDVKQRLLDRFQSVKGGGLCEQFLAMHQRGTVRDYVGEFELLAGQLPDLSEQVLEGTFMKGLRPEISAVLRIMQPADLTQAMKMAISLEESPPIGKTLGTLLTPTPLRQIPSHQGQPKNSGAVPARFLPYRTGGSSVSETTNRTGQYRRLTGAEMADKRAKGLCFRCDEKFLPGHRCPSKSLQVLIMDGDEEESNSEEEQEVCHAEAEHVHLDNVEVSLDSVIGFTPPHTMKMVGHISGHPFVILIDSGATHNFLSPRVVSTTGL